MPAIHKRAKARPAEATGGAGASITALAFALGASTGVVAALGILAGMLPAAVTLLVANGGLVGVWRRLLHGDSGDSGQTTLEFVLVVLLILVLFGGALATHWLWLVALVLLVLLIR